MIVEHFLLSKGSSIDSERNSLSIFDMIEDTTITYGSGEPPKNSAIECMITIVFLREREIGPFKKNVSLIYAPPQEKAHTLPIVVEFADTIKRYRVRVVIPLLLGRVGDHSFRVMDSKPPKELVSRSITINWIKANS